MCCFTLMSRFSSIIFGGKMEKSSKLLPFPAKYGIISTVQKKRAKKNIYSIRKDELMREAKNVVTVLGAVAVCLFGGLGIAYKSTPQMTSGNNVEIAEPASTESTVAANETSVSTTTTAIVTTAPKTTKNITVTTTTAAPTTKAAAAPVTSAAAKSEEEELVLEEKISKELNVYYGVRLDAASTTTATTTAPVTTTSEETTTTTTSETTTTTTTTTSATTTTSVTTTAPVTTTVKSSLPITDSEFVILCNVVAHEAGCSWITEYDKAKVVEVIMNRVYSPLFPNTITAVLSQPYQFTGAPSYAFNGTYVPYCTESVKNAVRLYFSDPSQFNHGYFYFWGDGYQNHFS